MSRRQVNILWTGGLDSSFRVIELSQMDVIIQPYYIVDPVRSSIKYELKAINTITNIIRKHPKTKATLLDLKKIYLNQIKEDTQITDAFSRLHNKYVIGHQYDLIARYADQNDIRFEMSLEKSDRSKAMSCICSETTLVPLKDSEYSIYRINPSESSKDGNLVFSNIDLPTSLWHITKLEEVEQLKRMGHSETIKYTWFCHFPVFGLPCGHCNPCQDSIKEGLSFRVPLKGRLLYYFYKPLKSITNRILKNSLNSKELKDQ
ncbi:MAG: hypothetical protein NC453_15685 [Muribaculum sp.]|nr:hypothetical protein [Muribaculum sp.]